MKALFVVRHNNDFDWIAPVACGWARQSPAHESLVLAASPELALAGDWRAAILAREPRVTLHEVWDVGRHGAFSGALSGRLRSAWSSLRAGMKLRRKALQVATEFAIAGSYDDRLAALLERWRPDIVAFDWYRPPARRRRFGHFGYQAIMRWAAARAVPVVSLPHGLQLFVPQNKAAEAFDTRYALTFVESAEHADRLAAAGLARDSIAVCGSPRYDPSWVARIAAAFDDGAPLSHDRPARDGRVTVAFFATKRVYDFDFSLLLSWLRELAAHPRVDLVVQPHPRGQRAAVFASLAALPNVTIDATTPAPVLIGRADIVSTLVSSVMVEAVVRGREILYPRFVNTVVTRFEEKDACLGIERMEDTRAAIDAYLAGRRVPRENYDAFLAETVFGGGSPDAIDRICRRMAAVAAPRA